jgi:hypothetical protein
VINIILFTFLLAAPPSDFALSVIKALPTWKADALAQYEQAELAAIRQDLDEGASDKQLRVDWDKLAALDKLLQVEDLI